jgi:hypothetical protein
MKLACVQRPSAAAPTTSSGSRPSPCRPRANGTRSNSVQRVHAERAMGHIIEGVRGTYDRYEYLEEKRRAFEALAALVKLILHPPADNVAQMPEQT